MDSKEEQEKMRLHPSLAIIVWRELREKYGIQQRKDKQGFPDWSCTREELGLITKLKIENPNRGTLKGISQLYNLQSLTVASVGSSEYKKNNDIATITDADMREICRINGLKFLEINNQADVSYIDLTQLKNLQDLSIINNPNLEEIDGFDSQTKLKGLTCYGNRSLMQVQGLNQCINQCEELMELNLDVLLFPDSIDYNPITGKYNQETANRIAEIANSVKWHEALPALKYTAYKRDSIQINHYQMLQMHNKCCKILAENVPEHARNRDTILGIETYLAQNVTYDRESLKGKSRMASKDGISIGPVGGANGAYNAIMLDQCVCEGYTRAMQYLLKLKGINSRNVRCIGTKDTLHLADKTKETIYTRYELPDEGYHSIICIEDEDLLYCDPCWNAGLYQAKNGDKSLPYTLLNKNEISQTHTLSFQERRVANEHITVPRNLIAQSIARNNLFKNTRMGNVRQMAQEIRKENYKGQVKEERETI